MEHLPRYGLSVDDQYLQETLSRCKWGLDRSAWQTSESAWEDAGQAQHDFLIGSIKKYDGTLEVEDRASVEQEWAPRKRMDPLIAQDHG